MTRKLTPERIVEITDGAQLSIRTTPRGFRATVELQASELLELLADLAPPPPAPATLTLACECGGPWSLVSNTAGERLFCERCGLPPRTT